MSRPSPENNPVPDIDDPASTSRSSTIGTGTVMAIGCVLLAIIVLVVTILVLQFFA